jgi:hypothetical protein
MTRRATWTNEGTHEGVTAWSLHIDGAYVGALERQRPARYAAGARRGLARDTSKAWEYDGEAFDAAVSRVVSVTIPEGSTLRQAKAIVEAAARAEIAR